MYAFFTQDLEAKGRIHVSNINVMLLPKDFCDKDICMLISSRVNVQGTAKPRHMFVYASSNFVSTDNFR